MTSNITVTIESLGTRGDGIGRLPDGRRVFVSGVLPDEVVSVTLGDARDDGVSGRLESIVQASPNRIAAACQHFGACGGCVLQQMNVTTYSAFKMDQVRKVLERNNLLIDVIDGPHISAPGSRRRATMAAFKASNRLVVGFNEQRSNKIVDLQDCPVLSPRLMGVLPPLRRALSDILQAGQGMDISVVESGGAVDMVLRPWVKKTRNKKAEQLPLKLLERMAAFAEEADIDRLSWQNSADDETDLTPLAWRKPFTVDFSGVKVTPPPGAFLQATVPGETALVRAVLEALANTRKKPKLVADLYAGCGTFTFAMAVEKYRVHAVEGFVPALNALQGSLRGFAITTEKRDLARDPLIAKEMKDYDAVVMDPPRVGAAEQAKMLAKSEVPLVISVSCSPASFAKDAVILKEGGYRFEKLTVIDQFLWSPHVELVGVFRR
ncbi:MAG: class I SAM-dependent RNA methyltransferase [Micavibrio sp.]